MSAYLPLFSLSVEHAYFSDGRGLRLEFRPSAECAHMLKLMRLSLRQEDSRLEVWQEIEEIPPIPKPAAAAQAWRAMKWESPNTELCFSFEIVAHDALFSFYTDMPKAGLNFANQSFKEGVAPVQALGERAVEYLSEVEGAAAGQKFGGITVELHGVQLHTMRKEEGSSAVSKVNHPFKQYVVALKSKQIHWKYFFSGSLAKRKLHIVDLDAEESGLGIGFVDSSLAATKDGLAMISTSAIAMRHRPSQRFQLREAGAGERILVERLPNASLAKIGKEKGRDGASMVVAEIYIHQ